MRLLLASFLLSLPLATLAALEGDAPGAEPTTTQYSTSTQTLTKTLAGNTVTSTLPSGESTPPSENSPSSTTTSSSSAEVVTSNAPVESLPVTSPVEPSDVPSMTTLPSVVVSTALTGAPYPIPGSSGAAVATGTAAPTGTGVPIQPAPPGIEPFKGAASKLAGHSTLVALAVMVVTGLALS
ncbi:MAG: hypothetical protein L6R40_005735 [Gallowayella cf. fulva]|nr:MAG: hypothetical protein L6R40_005735 [Xanthomendoza cf. fulva]